MYAVEYPWKRLVPCFAWLRSRREGRLVVPADGVGWGAVARNHPPLGSRQPPPPLRQPRPHLFPYRSRDRPLELPLGEVLQRTPELSPRLPPLGVLAGRRKRGVLESCLHDQPAGILERLLGELLGERHHHQRKEDRDDSAERLGGGESARPAGA